MKKTDTFRIDYAWWDKNRPEAMPSTGLGEALKAYAAAKAGLTADRDTLSKAMVRLQAVDAARLKAIGKCTGPLFPDAKVVLTRGEAVIEAERKVLGEAYAEKVIANLDGAMNRLAARMKSVTSHIGSTRTTAGKLPKLDAKLDKDKLAAMVQLHTSLDKETTNFRIAVQALGSQIDVNRNAMGALRKVDDDRARDALERYDEAIELARAGAAQLKSFCDLLDDWEGRLAELSPGYATDQLRFQGA